MKAIKKEVYEANLELVNRKLVIYTWGNVSAIDRVNNLVVIKPRGIEYEDLCAEDMSVVDMEGNLVEGRLLPSVDLDIHLEIYKNLESVGGIAHTHSTWATAWCQCGRGIPVYGTTHADHFYGEIPCTRQLTKEEVKGEYERNLGRIICDLFKGRDPLAMGAVLTAGHGPFTWGKDAKAAVEHSVILEELAKMAKLSLDIAGGNCPLLPDFMTEKHYTRKYGANSYFYQSK
ncbi:L-ribulose-5-phosphate 4-epimerase AraD [Pelosinus propionicus]|uniref:L-ribulose-5-phosphate 4-epimerase AraD n=1 Tax=Pelosinus propionicus TaxID=380084 RepID=UPI001587BC24|nr:L-ribulose-5-phosphate 4-epimerase AraD [Pelosinus propionicus]